MSVKRRFTDLNEDEILSKRLEAVPKNTKKSQDGAAELLRAYLREKEKTTNFEDLSEDELAETLCHFYLNVRTKEGELYKGQSLASIRYSLNRHLKSPPYLKKFDIINSLAFVDANECFKAAMTEIKKAGKGAIDHYQMVTQTDMQKLYSSIFLSPETPSGLLNRVQMNIRLYFCRRANENMEKMTKETFKLSTYEDGTKYILKSVDELTKNHRGNDNELVSGHMPEDKENASVCPVRTFIFYISKLNPACDRLWQYPKESYQESDEIWFQNRPMGRNSLSKFMQTLSKNASLSKIYTNHCIRVTGASLLSQNNVNAAQIMAITGHKSVSSLTVYQKVTDREKQSMGTVLNQSTLPVQPALLPPNVIPALPAPIQKAIQAPNNLNNPVARPASSNLGVSPFSYYMEGINEEDLFSEFHQPMPQALQTSNRVAMSFQNPRGPIFHNCSLSNITVNINYN